MQDLTQHQVPQQPGTPRRFGSADPEPGVRCPAAVRTAGCTASDASAAQPECAQMCQRCQRCPVQNTRDRRLGMQSLVSGKRKGSRAMPSPGGLHAKFGVACSGAQQWKSATADANVNKLRLKSEVGWQPEKWSRPLKPGSEIGSKLVGWTAASIRTGSPSTHPRATPGFGRRPRVAPEGRLKSDTNARRNIC